MGLKGNKTQPVSFDLLPRAAGSHSLYLVESGLNSSTSNRNKHQHCTEYKLCKHISIDRTEASDLRSEKNRGIQNQKWHISA